MRLPSLSRPAPEVDRDILALTDGCGSPAKNATVGKPDGLLPLAVGELSGLDGGRPGRR